MNGRDAYLTINGVPIKPVDDWFLRVHKPTQYNLTLDQLLYMPSRVHSYGQYGHGLVVDLGPSDLLSYKGVPARRIASLYAPTKCTHHVTGNNFKPICDTAKLILLGVITMDNWKEHV